MAVSASPHDQDLALGVVRAREFPLRGVLEAGRLHFVLVEPGTLVRYMTGVGQVTDSGPSEITQELSAVWDLFQSSPRTISGTVDAILRPAGLPRRLLIDDWALFDAVRAALADPESPWSRAPGARVLRVEFDPSSALQAIERVRLTREFAPTVQFNDLFAHEYGRLLAQAAAGYIEHRLRYGPDIAPALRPRTAILDEILASAIAPDSRAHDGASWLSRELHSNRVPEFLRASLQALARQRPSDASAATSSA